MINQLFNLVKIAKQKLESKERQLQRNQALIARKNADIDSINTTIAATSAPTQGNFALYQGYKDSINALLYEIDEIRGQIGLLRQEQEHIKNELKAAHLEYEKMQHIYNKAKDEINAKNRASENRKLDELNTILHINKNEKSRPSV